jgi:hypothetical protein
MDVEIRFGPKIQARKSPEKAVQSRNTLQCNRVVVRITQMGRKIREENAQSRPIQRQCNAFLEVLARKYQ